MLSDVLWQVQQAIHGKKNSAVLPACLVATASALFLYCHATDQQGDDPTKTFLALIVVQMLPLIFLEKKILSCPDPVAMLSRFGTKVLLMHIAFLGLRVLAWPILEVGLGVCNLLSLIGAFVALQLGFHFQWSLTCAKQNLDVVGLVVLAIGAAFLTGLFDFNRHSSLLENTIFSSSSYIEILAFVPAVWLVHLTAKKDDDKIRDSDAEVQREATFFFLFLIVFYVSEDLVSAIRLVSLSRLTAFGHVVHFALVLDFACFLLAYIFNPGKAPINLMSWMSGGRWV